MGKPYGDCNGVVKTPEDIDCPFQTEGMLMVQNLVQNVGFGLVD